MQTEADAGEWSERGCSEGQLGENHQGVEMDGWLASARPSAPPWPVVPGADFQTGREMPARPVASDRRTPGGHSSRVEGHPGNPETFPNELCIETFSFAASLLMHINKWYARPHLIH